MPGWQNLALSGTQHIVGAWQDSETIALLRKRCPLEFAVRHNIGQQLCNHDEREDQDQ